MSTAPKRCLEAGCTRHAMPGYSRCLPHQRPRWRTYNDPAYRLFGIGVRCEACGGIEDLTRDHIKPIARGGTNHHDNLRTLCRSCNSSKGRTTDAQ